MSARRTIDVSQLPTYAFGHHALTWWATWSMLLMEGTMLVILLMSYFFLRTGVPNWPPGDIPPPNLFWGTLNTAIILGSAFPNHFAKRAAEHLDLQRVKLWTIVVFAFAVAFALIRILEFKNLNVHWMQNAYGSIVWFNMGFHTAHLLTDMVDTVVLLALMYLGPIEGKRFVDFQENCIYWNFVIVISFRDRIPESQVWQLAAYVRSMSGLVRKDVAPTRDDHLQGRPPESMTKQKE